MQQVKIKSTRKLIQSVHRRLMGTDLNVSEFLMEILNDAGHDYLASDLSKNDFKAFWDRASCRRGDTLAFVFGETCCLYAAQSSKITNKTLVKWISMLLFLAELHQFGHGEISLYYEQIWDCLSICRRRLGAETACILAQKMCQGISA